MSGGLDSYRRSAGFGFQLEGMPHQPSLSQREFAHRKKTSRREKFLARMETFIRWVRLLVVIVPFYPKGKRGRPPVGLERMLRVYFLRQCNGLAGETLEDAPCDSQARRGFVRMRCSPPRPPPAWSGSGATPVRRKAASILPSLRPGWWASARPSESHDLRRAHDAPAAATPPTRTGRQDNSGTTPRGTAPRRVCRRKRMRGKNTSRPGLSRRCSAAMSSCFGCARPQNHAACELVSGVSVIRIFLSRPRSGAEAARILDLDCPAPQLVKRVAVHVRDSFGRWLRLFRQPSTAT